MCLNSQLGRIICVLSAIQIIKIAQIWQLVSYILMQNRAWDNVDTWCSLSSLSFSFTDMLHWYLWPFRFEVSKVVWNLLLTKCKELRHLKHKYGLYGSKKSGGRYRPYSNVDSFLKVIHYFHGFSISHIKQESPTDALSHINSPS